MNKFFVEKFNASDDSFQVSELHISAGDFVKEGALIFAIESSKADIDVEAPLEGYYYFVICTGTNINIGELFHIVS